MTRVSINSPTVMAKAIWRNVDNGITATSAKVAARISPPRIFRPTIMVHDEQAQVLIEQTTAVAPERFGELVGHVSRDELEQINSALRLALELD